jgi:heme iron utilization protein
METASRFTGAEARHLLRHVRHGSLATLDRETGYPYASLVNFATDLAGKPVIFISRLARHTQNLLNNPKASLLAARLPASGDVLTGPRVTVLGTLASVTREEVGGRYADHHPQARMYLDFPDFSFWRLEPELVHAVAGFGRIETLEARDVFLPEPVAAGFAELAQGAAAHLNQDHSDAVQLYATRLLAKSGTQWRVTSIDPDGTLLEGDGEVARLDFDSPVSSPAQLRTAFVQLASQARMM